MQITPDVPSPVQNPLWSTNVADPRAALERFSEANVVCLNVMSEAASSWSSLLGQMLGSRTPWEAADLYVKWLSDSTNQAMKIRQQLGEAWMPVLQTVSEAPAEKSRRRQGQDHYTEGGSK
jgi:hypothetical protein